MVPGVLQCSRSSVVPRLPPFLFRHGGGGHRHVAADLPLGLLIAAPVGHSDRTGIGEDVLVARLGHELSPNVVAAGRMFDRHRTVRETDVLDAETVADLLLVEDGDRVLQIERPVLPSVRGGVDPLGKQRLRMVRADRAPQVQRKDVVAGIHRHDRDLAGHADLAVRQFEIVIRIALFPEIAEIEAALLHVTVERHLDFLMLRRIGARLVVAAGRRQRRNRAQNGAEHQAAQNNHLHKNYSLS